jgi:hypothetical protein
VVEGCAETIVVEPELIWRTQPVLA